jgi:hypothetical protein
MVIMTKSDATTCKKQHKRKEKKKQRRREHRQEERKCKSQNKNAMNSQNTYNLKLWALAGPKVCIEHGSSALYLLANFCQNKKNEKL